KPEHDRRVISRVVRAERAALPESGAGELAWETPDRLPLDVRPKALSGRESYEDNPEPELHARGRSNSSAVANAGLTNWLQNSLLRKAAVASAIPSGEKLSHCLACAKCAEHSAHYNVGKAGMNLVA